MSDEMAKPGSTPFDVRTVRQLVALMTQHDLSEIDLRDGAQRVRLRRGSETIVAAPTFAAPVVPQAPLPAAAPTAGAPAAPATTAAGPKRLEIKSESVGTFYAKPSPDAAPFVTVGSKISATTVVCVIEAMKVFNEIQAGIAGTIAEVCVENQSVVEFGQVLFRVDPA